MNGGLRPEAARQQVTVAYFWMMGLYSRDLSSTGSLPHVCWGHLDKIMTTVRGAGADDPEPHLAFCKSSTTLSHLQSHPSLQVISGTSSQDTSEEVYTVTA